MGKADAEVEVPPADNPELSKVLLFNPGVDQTVALCVSPTARKSGFLISASPFI